MVNIRKTGFLSDIKGEGKSRSFPKSAFEEITDAVESVPDAIFEQSESGRELRAFDAHVADALDEYEHEHHDGTGRNSACKLWEADGFDHSVDLYNPEERIAIEIEKSERKRVSDDILKFIKGGKTQRDKRKKIEFGCLIVPVNYRGSGDLSAASIRNLEFMRSVLFIEDIAVIGYTDPRWD